MILYPPENNIAFSLFGLNIRYYGIIMAFSILVGVFLTSYLIKKKLSKKDSLIFLDISPLIILFSIFGARLFYVIGDFKYYLNNPMEIIMLNHGGLSIYGAILTGILAFYFYSKIKNFYLLKYLDVISSVIPLCQCIGRFGNFINQEAYGRAYDGFLKMYIDYNHRYLNLKNIKYYHPAFLYESILNLILFIILICLLLKNKNLKSGAIFLIYLISYSLIRIIIESIRIDSVMNVGNIPIAIIISIIIIILSLIYLIKLLFFTR